MYCPSCNTLNRDDAKFCKGCGQSLHATQAAPAEPTADATNHADVEETQSAPVDATNHVSAQPAAVETGAPEAQWPEDDPTLAPTLILSPEKMMAYHQRRWQDAREAQATPEPYASSTNIYDAPTVISEPMPMSVASEQAQNVSSSPASPLPAQDEQDAIPIPPPPPPESLVAGAKAETGAKAGTDNATDAQPEAAPADAPDQASAEHDQDDAENAGYPAMEASEPMQDSSEHISLEQAEQAAPSGDFALLATGVTLQGRYEISQVLADNPQEHVYQVIDHQGYQRCWNCSSENNAAGDDFCIDCGASLLDIPYTMHEYSAEQSQEDTPVLQGNIVNTFVDQGRTYVIEQIQAEQNTFPNGVHLLAATSSDAGNVRRSDPNEDSSLVLQLQRIHESLSSPVGVYIVADGMGGHDNGQLASRMTINVIAERMVRDLLLAPLAAEKEGTPAKAFDEEALITLLHDAIEEANTALCSVNTRDKTDMGSTLTGFMVVGEHAYIVNVGDSRTYMVRGKQLYQLTTDHSLVGQLVASGLIEPDDVYTHPQRSQIYRSLGDKPNTQIDIFKQQLHPGDILLSCCDGLWEMVRNPQIESTLNNAPDPQTACQQLIDMANTNGGEDNITAVIVYVQ